LTERPASELIRATSTALGARAFIEQHGDIFAVFDSATQDSGNVAFGVETDDARFFVKTAGTKQDCRPFLAHRERVALLRNAVHLRRAVPAAALPALHQVVESADGPILIYDWVEGELLRKQSSPGSEPSSAFVRFRGDFYDGCLIYDFASSLLHVIDLDNYRKGPFFNDMGRMFGSTRFMAPEEHELGVRIDERTTVFTLGRTIEQLFPAADPRVRSVASRACEPHPRQRFQSVHEFYQAWSAATRHG
jgi:serine/threonine-protein kinase